MNGRRTSPGSIASAVLIAAVRAYQWGLRPLIGANCRFEPHCSAYAVDAIRSHGALAGAMLSGRRILRCNPWCAGGHDPVPAPRPGPKQAGPRSMGR